MKMYSIIAPIGAIVLIAAIYLITVNTTNNTNNNTDTSLKNGNYKTATFAGGCFWCMEPAYQEKEGVIKAITGYAGGKKENASYKKVALGKTDHREAVQVTYDPEKITYKELLDIFWRQIDPTDAGGQFTDRGFQYTTAIFWHDNNQKELAEKSKKDLENSNKFEDPIATKILKYTTFFPAEEYHQDYYKKSSEHYKRYKKGSGREDFIEENWAREAALEAAEEDENKNKGSYNLTEEEIQNRLENLDQETYNILVKEGTERPFDNEYWDNKEEGIYVDVVTGEPLFSSTHKFESGTGWPSFWRTIEDDAVTLHEDNKLLRTRTEVRNESGHLGHLFQDGPQDKGGKRYCMNSATLRFIPKKDMKDEGYEDYLYLFN